MNQKPLTRERKLEIEAELRVWITKGRLPQMLEDVYAAETFWREAVKQVTDPLVLFDSTTSDWTYQCCFCRNIGDYIDPFAHADGCAYLLAQENS